MSSFIIKPLFANQERKNIVKILKFAAQNIKGIRVVEITPDGDIVTISGKNGAGKSAVLDAIQGTLCGGALEVRNGEDKGRVDIDLGEYTVSRVIGKTDQLVVKNKDGAKYPSPREFLSKLIGALAIDPLAFIRLDDKKQIEAIYRLCPELKGKLDDINTGVATIKQKRSDIIRETNTIKMQMEQGSEVEKCEPPPATKDLLEQIRSANETNKERQLGRDRRENILEQIQAHDDDITSYREKIKEMQKGILDLELLVTASADRKLNFENEVAALPTTPDDVDVSDVLKQIQGVDDHKKRFERYQWQRTKQEVLSGLRELYSDLGKQMSAVEDEKKKVLAGAGLPVAGLSVSDDGVLYNGVKVSTLCTAEKVRVGASLAVAQNPQAKIVLADDVSLLDKENLKILHETCADFQLWQVVNDDSGDVGIYIEDGTYTEAVE